LGVLATRHGLDANNVSSITQLNVDELPTYSGYDVIGFLEVIHKHGTVALVTGGRGNKHYHGKIVILTDENTASASEGFISAAKETKAATLIGRTTEGAMLSSRDFEVSGGWVLRLPEADFCTPKGFRPEGVGIEPDIAVKKVAGKDADLQTALKFLEENK
jgi:C-terminal processing protease CtpA/Prc